MPRKIPPTQTTTDPVGSTPPKPVRRKAKPADAPPAPKQPELTQKERALRDKAAAREAAKEKKAQEKARHAVAMKEQQEQLRVKQVVGEAGSPYPHAQAMAKSADGPNALVRVSYRVGGRMDETVFMVRRGAAPITRAVAHAHGVALASRSDAVAGGYWVSLRDSRHWQPTAHACRIAPRVIDDVGETDGDRDDDVDVIVPDALQSTMQIGVWRWVMQTLFRGTRDGDGSWQARVPKSVAALGIATLRITK